MKRHKITNKKVLFKIIIISGFVLTFFLFLNANFRPVIKKMAAYQATNIATAQINRVVSDELNSKEYDYSDITTIIKDKDGNVKAVETDIVKINRLKTNVLKTLAESMEEYETKETEIPLGTLLGNELLSGKGPMVPFHIIPIGYIEGRLENKFSGAGINQTLHQISLVIEMTGNAVIPFVTSNIKITCNYCISETIIVGTVPESFTEVTDGRDSTFSKINDYKSE